VLDFGLAKLMPERNGVAEGASGEHTATRDVNLTSPGTTLGTVAYMSPEQARGALVDARSDIFSFGVVLYELCTGRDAFPGTTSAVIFDGILNRTPPPAALVNPELPGALQDIIGHALDKDADRRYQTAAAMLADLRALKRDSDSGRSPAVVAPQKSVAVLFFENISGSKEDEYFRDGMTEDVITELSGIEGLRVFPRSAVLAFRDRSVTAPEIGRELKAAYVLGGSLRRAADRLRITAQLVDTGSGHSVWAKRYDRQLEDVFAIQGEIAQNIAQALQVVLSDKEKRAIEKAPTQSVQAYDYYLRGRQFFHQFRRKSIEFAQRMFDRAIEIDPAYARAFAGVADCWSLQFIYWNANRAYLKQAEESSRKALELDPELAEAHVALGVALSLSRRFEQARDCFMSARRLNPRLFEAYYFHGRSCIAEGKLEEAARALESACANGPEDFQAPNLLGLVQDGLQRRSQADAAYRSCLELVEKQLEMHPDDVRALYLGAQAACRLGQAQKGVAWARRAASIDAEDPGVAYNVACVFALAGDTEEAVGWLERAVKYGFGLREWIENDSLLESLRGHARYKAVLELM
jgi:non-specific serine/threonine protein kinase